MFFKRNNMRWDRPARSKLSLLVLKSAGLRKKLVVKLPLKYSWKEAQDAVNFRLKKENVLGHLWTLGARRIKESDTARRNQRRDHVEGLGSAVTK